MSTVNLGQIKPVFKGAYNNSTAYVLDNIVTSGGSSYICILASTGNAVSNATYWTLIAQGSDVATTLTTEGDILYRNASAPARLAKGTAGQALVMNSGASAPEWGAGGKATEVHVFADDNVGAVSNTGNFISWGFTPTISGKVFLAHTGNLRSAGSGTNHHYISYWFNNGSGEVGQHLGGVGYAISGTDHNQGWSVSFVPTTTSGDSTTPMLVTANTACNFRVKHDGAATANAGDDTGKDHIVTAIIFET